MVGMFRFIVLVAATASAIAGISAASAQVPPRFASNKNVKLFFDDELLKASTHEIEGAYRHEVEAIAHVVADCDAAPLMPVTPEVCARAINYFLVVNSQENRALPRLVTAMGAAAREMRLSESGQPDKDQAQAMARWVKVQGALANAARDRLLALAKDGK